MSVLLVDVGNTRIKWARLTRAGLPGRMQAAVHAGWGVAGFRRALFAGRKPGRVLAVSVAPAAVERALRRAAREAGWGEPLFLRSAAVQAGVRNGYREAWRLGADRWAALLGARALCGPGQPACIVDVGTAVTIDLLGPDGRHRGGAIIPGPDLMVASLLESTGGIRRRARGGGLARGPAPRELFARATAQALEAGALHAVAAVIERAVVQSGEALRRRGGSPPRLLLTGGAAPRIRRCLVVPHDFVPDLVLRGLAVVA